MNEIRDRLARMTPQERAALIGKVRQRHRAGSATIPRRSAGRRMPLSSAQERLWFLEQLDPDHVSQNIAGTLVLDGPFDPERLRRAMESVQRRHEVLRTAIRADGQGVEQVVLPEPVLEYQYVDLVDDDESERTGMRDTPVEELLRGMAVRRFDPASGRMLRLCIVRTSRLRHIVLVSMHHMVGDGGSIPLMIHEAWLGYRAAGKGEFSELAVQYGDYAAWQRRELERDVEGRVMSHWRDALEGMPQRIGLRSDKKRKRSSEPGGRSARQKLHVSSDLVTRIREVASGMGATPFHVYMAAYGVALMRFGAGDDFAIGVPVSLRTHPELQPLIGCFLNMLPIRMDMRGGLSFGEVVLGVRQGMLSALEHVDTPFEEIVANLSHERDATSTPIFQVTFSFERSPETRMDIEPGLKGSFQELALGNSVYDFSLELNQEDRDVSGWVDYSIELYDEHYVRRFLDAFLMVLRNGVEALQTPVDRLPILSQDEREQVLNGFNATQAEYPREALIHELFEAQVERTPDAVAVQAEDGSLTYADLNSKANQLAHLLRALRDERGQPMVGPDASVAISTERSLEMVVGLLGILKAGGAYVPVDPEYPVERVEYMLKDSQARVLLTQKVLLERLPASVQATGMVVLLDEEGTYAGQSQTNPGRQDTGITSRNLAYVIYTSGSTGLPKGVMVEHQGVCNLAQVQGNIFAVDDSSRVLQFASLSFDACTWELVMALSHGAQLHLGSTEVLMPGEPLCWLLEDRGITHVTLPPAALGVMENVPALEDLQVLVVAGETCPIGTARAWSQGRRFVNAYGPTEATVCATMQVIDDGLDEAQSNLPIGRPIANARVYILDGQGQPMPLGVAGEIYIGGEGVARGYLNRPELTAERFVKDPFAGGEGARMYRTGDLGRWREDGTIEYLGRNDDQVKIRGFRIELGEIEARLLELQAVREAVVLAREDVPGDRRLVAYWTQGDKEQELEVESLREHLKAELPGYMVPSAFVRLEAMPLTPNGKVDRKALPAPDASALVAREYEAPQGQAEEVLAAIWQELLGVEKVGRHDSFFDLGGHSLQITQVVSQVNEKLGVDVSVRMLFEHSTLKDLADVIDARNTEGGQDGPADHVALVNLDDEVVLDSTIHVSEALAPAVSLNDARSVLLTGATGFLGAFLLRDLVQRSRAQVYCLVRADDETLAMERIVQGLAKYDLWDESMRERIVPICGDLAKPLLGLGPARFESLADDVDLIVHNGAWVNFLYPYEVLKDANVLGTQEVLRLATRIRLKPVHHVSTISVFPAHEHMRRITESTELDSWKGLQGGYSQSKWVAEKLMFLAAERGIPVCIHRPGSISGDTLHGACPTHDLIFRLMKTCVELSMAPDLGDFINMAPVDYVSAAIVQLARQLPGGKVSSSPQVSHLVNPHRISSNRFYEMVSGLGYPVKLVPADQWYPAMLTAARRSEEHALYRFLPILSGAKGDEPSDDGTTAQEMHQPEYECVQTQVALEGSGIVCPELDEELLALYFEYFEHTGFLRRLPRQEEDNPKVETPVGKVLGM